MTLLHGTYCVLLVLNNGWAKERTAYECSVRTALEANLYFSAMALMRKEVVEEKLNICQTAMNSTLANIAGLLVQKAWDVRQRLICLDQCWLSSNCTYDSSILRYCSSYHPSNPTVLLPRSNKSTVLKPVHQFMYPTN